MNSDRPDPITSLAQVDEYDRLQHDYSGLPGGSKTTPAIVQVIPLSPLAGVAEWTVQTIRAADVGDLVFLNRMGAQPMRIVLPAKVTAMIARQREALTSKARSRAARGRVHTGDASHLNDPKVRAKALATRKAKAAKRRRAGSEVSQPRDYATDPAVRSSGRLT